MACISIISLVYLQQIYRTAHVVKDVETELKTGFSLLHEKADKIQEVLHFGMTNSFFTIDWLLTDPEKSSVISFVLQADSLVFWNDHTVTLPDKVKRTIRNCDTLLFLNNGYYQLTVKDTIQYRIITALKVYSLYAIENEYLENSFTPRFGIGSSAYSLNTALIGEGIVRAESGRPLFSITRNPQNIFSKGAQWVIVLLFITWLFSFSLLLFRAIEIKFKFLHLALSLGLFVLGLVFFRYILQGLLSVSDFSNAQLFTRGGAGYGPLFPGYFDLLYAIFGLFLTGLYLTNGRSSFQKDAKKQTKLQASLLVFCLALTLFIFIGLVDQIIYHSSIAQIFNSITQFDSTNYLLFLVLALLSVSIFFFIYYLSVSLVKGLFNLSFYLISALFSILPFVVLSNFLNGSEGLLMVSYVFVLFIIWFYRNKTASGKGILFGFWLILLFTGILTWSYNSITQHKKDLSLELTAYKLSLEKDPMFEFLYAELDSVLRSDTSLKNLALSRDVAALTIDDTIVNYLKNKYINDIFKPYTINVTVCLPDENLNIQPENYIVNCADYFQEIIRNTGQTTDVKGLYFIDNNIQGSYYLSSVQLPFTNHSGNWLTLYLEFYSRFVPEGLGYPELLIDARKGFSDDFSTFSFAKYRDQTLVYKFGDFMFPSRLADIGEDQSGFKDQAGYRHFILPVNEQKTLIISRLIPDFQEFSAPFSLFFLLILLLSFITYVFWFSTSRKISTTLNFRLKLQIFIFGALSISFFALGIVSVAYIRGIYKQKHSDFLNERTHSIKTELEQKLRASDFTNKDNRDYLHQLLLKFSLIFYSDINLFNTNGQLLATSRPEIFSTGLISSRMNQHAFQKLRNQRAMYYLQQERIGKGSYYSSYVPFLDAKGNPVAYLNLPYFARESEIRNEISGFVFAYLNIFLALSAVATGFALLLSRRLTKPMFMIQEKMKSVRIGEVNEKIEWKGQDELGKLVAQYNQLIDELEISAGLLARSERESAWREMARQVAHEIKNPLTPMRLSIQFLQRAWIEQDPELKDKFERTTQTLIEQIDTLSDIASAFSDFAKMPEFKPEQTNLTELLSKVIHLYNLEASNPILWVNQCSETCLVFADSKNLSRAFHNLIKNAIQATSHLQKPFIEVGLFRERDEYVVRISDNGTGIPESEQEKIFKPNFTTKSSGMGIGLSIVQNVVKASGGSVSFETTQGKGTSFVVRLPMVEW